MRLIFLSAFLFSLSAQSSTVEGLALQLGKMAAMGVTEHPLQGTSEKDLLFSYLHQVADLQEDNEIYVNHPSVELFDEYVYGTTDAKNFSSLITGAIHFMDEDALKGEAVYSQEKIASIQQILSQLQTHDVIYSWNPGGDSVCGMLLTTPVIIDSQTKKAYEFNFFKIEGC